MDTQTYFTDEGEQKLAWPARQGEMGNLIGVYIDPNYDAMGGGGG